MGFTGLARWANAHISALDDVRDNLKRNHQAEVVGAWQLSIRSYRSSFMRLGDAPMPPDRSMHILTMGENSFVYIDDPGAPSRAEVLATQLPQPTPSTTPPVAADPALEPSTTEPATTQPEVSTQSERSTQPGSLMPLHALRPPHYRMTLLTIRPPGALEHLLLQLRARWVPIRQAAQTTVERGAEQRHAGQNVVVLGSVLRVGQDWLVRIGDVKLPGGASRGMLLEAEYLPMPVLPTEADGSSLLVSNFLASIVPFASALTSLTAVTISDAQWAELEPEDEPHLAEPAPGPGAVKQSTASAPESMAAETKADAVDERFNDDVFVYADEERAATEPRKGDWTGVERDRRSAFLIMAALRQEGLV